MKKLHFSRIKSFKVAFDGLWFNIRNETNFLIHIIAGALALIAALFFPISREEWMILLLTIGVVLSSELMNTSIEKLCDRFIDTEDRMIKVVKDSAAASVLIISIIAFIVGLIIFIPYLVPLLKRII